MPLNCARCRYRHEGSNCYHPRVGPIKDALLNMAVGHMLHPPYIKPLKVEFVKGQNGWPFEFEPANILSCDGYKELEDEQRPKNS